MAYARLEPFGEERADLRAGIVAATIANVFRGEGSPEYKPHQFMPSFEEQTPEEMLMAARMAFGFRKEDDGTE